MTKEDVYNFEISDSNFDQLVIMNSYKLPVFVLFMSASSSSCIAMENALIDYSEEFAGQFILARLDIDMYTEVRDRYEVKNVPMIKVFKDGQVVYQELGAISQEDLAAAFRHFDIFNPAEDLRLQAEEKHQNGETAEAVRLLTQAIQMNPGNIKIALDMCQVFLDINMLAEAAELFTKFPNNVTESDAGRFLIGQITFKKLALDLESIETLTTKLAENSDNENIKFDLAICLVANQQYQEGMDYLFEALKTNSNAKDGAAQELAVAIINMLDLKHSEIAGEFRRKLGTTLSV